MYANLRSPLWLKQASRQWNKRFDDEIKKFGFTQNPDEPCGNTTISNVTRCKIYLEEVLLWKDLGTDADILGIKIYRDSVGTIPMQEKLKLSKSQGASFAAETTAMRIFPYASAIGLIMYAVRLLVIMLRCHKTWTSRFNRIWVNEHLGLLVKNILKYLRNTKDMFLVYGGNMKRQLRVSCYTDAGYLTDADNLKSQTGYVFVLNGGAVDWKSTKQSIFATSSTDAEYIAAFDASKEAVWIRKFISGLGIVPTIEEPIIHYLRETIKMGDVRIEKIDTDDNLADPFTKALAFPKHSELTRNIGLLPASSFM
ncbi:hypothetical protein Tco_0481852 [Tanacetum coccineum]